MSAHRDLTVSRQTWLLAASAVIAALVLGGSGIAIAVIVSGQHQARLAALPTPSDEHLVKADPKTLVLQPGDYPPAWTHDPTFDGPTVAAKLTASARPLDSYSEVIDTGTGLLDSTVVLYGSTKDAQGVFAGIGPGQVGTLPIRTTVGDEQRAWSSGSTLHTVSFWWRSGNVIAGLTWTTTFPRTRPSPTTSQLTELDGVDLLFFQDLAPRVQTHIRLAAGR